MGVAHGVFCVGCCWSLMLVMFGVGLGSLTVMLGLGALTAVEKNLPWGRRLTRPLGCRARPGRGLRGRRVSVRDRMLGTTWTGLSAAPATPGRTPRAGDRRTRGPRSWRRPAPCLLADGYANLSTRAVAEAAEVPLSQIHYHFGSKQQLILAVLEAENRSAAGAPGRDVRRARAAVGSNGNGPATTSTRTSSPATSGSSRR